MRAGPCSEIPDGASSREQPPVFSVQRGTGLPYAQCHPSGVARSPAFTGGRVGYPRGTSATGKEISQAEEQKEVEERAGI